MFRLLRAFRGSLSRSWEAEFFLSHWQEHLHGNFRKEVPMHHSRIGAGFCAEQIFILKSEDILKRQSDKRSVYFFSDFSIKMAEIDEKILCISMAFSPMFI